MASSFAVIGPGRVGQALARRWREAGYRLLGFHGRGAASLRAAVAFAGGEALDRPVALAAATFVLVSVPDGALAEVAVKAAAGGSVRPCALWLHTSGATPVEVLAPVAAAGARIGSLHPLCPFPDAADGYVGLPGCVAALDGPPSSLRLLRVLARAAGLRPIDLGPTDRALYHAACALAANGATVLASLAEAWFAAASPAAAPRARELTASLMASALAAVQRRGAGAALTGPAARGDAAVLSRHLAALAAHGVPGRDTFVAAMHDAASLAAARRDLSPEGLARVLAALGRGRG